jgi:SAM-dependent methyltransferase
MPIRCPVCRSKNNKFVSPYPNAKQLFLKVDSLRQCHNCGLVFAWPMPSNGDLDGYYSNGIYHAEHEPFSAEFFDFSYQLAQSRIRLILKWIDPEQDKTFLDIGAGNAAFGKALKEAMPDSWYEAVEPHEGCRKVWGDWVFCSYSSLAETCDHYYSVITLNQVLEHLNRPIQFLSEITKRLIPGGFLFIDVPYRDDLYKPSVEPHLLFWEKRSLEHAVMTVGLETLYCDAVGMQWNQARRYFSHKTLRQRVLSPWTWVVGINRILRLFGIAKGFNTFQRFQSDSYGGKRNWLRCLARKGSK